MRGGTVMNLSQKESIGRLRGEKTEAENALIPALIPIIRGTKRPAYPFWNLRENCVIAHEDYFKLHGFDIAIAHAYCEPPTCCLDIDNVPLATPILETLGFDLAKARTTTYQSGRQGSLKLLYTLEFPMKTYVKTIGGRVVLEFRCANSSDTTVADVIPPSQHPSGTRYEYKDDRDLSVIQPLPNCLRTHWQMQLDQAKIKLLPVKNYKYDHCIIDSPREVAILRRKLTYISPDSDRLTWLRVVFSILATGLTNAVSIAEEWSSRSYKFIKSDFDSAVASYKPNRGIGIGTLNYFAKLGGYRD